MKPMIITTEYHNVFEMSHCFFTITQNANIISVIYHLILDAPLHSIM